MFVQAGTTQRISNKNSGNERKWAEIIRNNKRLTHQLGVMKYV